MKLLLITLLLVVPFTAYGIGYVIVSEPLVLSQGDTLESSVTVIGEPGQTFTVKASDDLGADMLVLPDSVTFGDSNSTEILFSVIVPNEYDDGQYTPYILATLESDKSHQVRINQQAKIKIPINIVSEEGGCLVATAAFGTELAPQVQLLRETRDNIVLSTASGAAFMSGFNSIYYTFAPTVSDWERQSPAFQSIIKSLITPMLATLHIMNLSEQGSESQVLGLGLSVIALNVGMYVAGPVFVAYAIKSRISNR